MSSNRNQLGYRMDTSEQMHYLVLSPGSGQSVSRNCHVHPNYALKQKFGQADDLNDLSVQLPRPYEIPSLG